MYLNIYNHVYRAVFLVQSDKWFSTVGRIIKVRILLCGEKKRNCGSQGNRLVIRGHLFDSHCMTLDHWCHGGYIGSYCIVIVKYLFKFSYIKFFLSNSSPIIALPNQSLLVLNFAQIVGFVRVVTWISLSFDMDFTKLTHGFFLVITWIF